MKKYKVGIVGATGYTGSELMRLLLTHPEVEIVTITSESRKGEKFSDVHPQFSGLCDQKLDSIKQINDFELDFVFLALPHGVSMDFVKENHNQPYKIVDLSGDFRLSSRSVFEEWYKKNHVFEEGFEQAVFGMPELFRKRIAEAKLVANPGCFPTASILGLAPLLKEGLVDENSIVIDAKTGVTGAGIKHKPNTHFPVVNDNLTAYGVKTHRHTIEIQEILNLYSGSDSKVIFTPHLLPVDRGIYATSYSKPTSSVSEAHIQKIYRDYYENEPFIRVKDEVPTLKQVRGTNLCDVFVSYDDRTNTVITISVIDNLVKGAAGQAIQNMNLMLGLPEDTGLIISPIQP